MEENSFNKGRGVMPSFDKRKGASGRIVNRLTMSQMLKFYDWIKAVEKERVAEGWSKEYCAKRATTELGFSVTTSNIRTLLESKQIEDWPDKMTSRGATGIGQFVQGVKEKFIVMDGRIKDLEQRLATLEELLTKPK